MSDLRYGRRIGSLVLLVAGLGGCALPAPEADPVSTDGTWEPLLAPRAAVSTPVPFPATAGGGAQSDGLALVVREIDALARLVDEVRRLPTPPGRFRVNFGRLQADLQVVRGGVIEALLPPVASPEGTGALHGQYRD